jgi:hypothetical protein
MTVQPIRPKGEALRRAVEWLAHQGPWTPELIGQASQRFDLSPTEEEFLLAESRRSARAPAQSPAQDDE